MSFCDNSRLHQRQNFKKICKNLPPPPHSRYKGMQEQTDFLGVTKSPLSFFNNIVYFITGNVTLPLLIFRLIMIIYSPYGVILYIKMYLFEVRQ
jgi:hypothetical protein